MLKTSTGEPINQAFDMAKHSDASKTCGNLGVKSSLWSSSPVPCMGRQHAFDFTLPFWTRAYIRCSLIHTIVETPAIFTYLITLSEFRYSEQMAPQLLSCISR